jgi:excisionase family DNA binding protein
MSTTAPSVAEPPALLDVRQVSTLLGCSPRTVYRLADAGKMPRPRRLGSLVRWSRDELTEWLRDGCRPVRTATAKGGMQ